MGTARKLGGSTAGNATGAASEVAMLAANVTTTVLGIAAPIGLVSMLVKRKRTKKSAKDIEGMLAQHQIVAEQLRVQLLCMSRQQRNVIIGYGTSHCQGGVPPKQSQQYSSIGTFQQYNDAKVRMTPQASSALPPTLSGELPYPPQGSSTWVPFK